MPAKRPQTDRGPQVHHDQPDAINASHRRLPFWGYSRLTSPDNLILIQIFVDLETGLIEDTYLSFREETWHSWGPPIKCQKEDA